MDNSGENMNLSIMYSGGLDSFIAYHYAKSQNFNVQNLFVDLGHPYANKEWNAISNLTKKYRPEVKKLDMKFLYDEICAKMNNQIIPSRNVLLGVIGSMFNPNVWINALDGEQLGKEHDKSEKFFEDTSKLLSFTNEYFYKDGTNIVSPFAKLTKAETIKWALMNDIPKEVLFETSTCYDETADKCGLCLTCEKRKAAFLLNGIDEPGYNENPFEQDYFKEITKEILLANVNKNYSRFTEKRIKEHLKLLDILGI